MWKLWLLCACLLAACANANQLEYEADKISRLAEIKGAYGDGAAAQQLYEEADAKHEAARLMRLRHHSRLWADVMLH